jgi:endonuclease III
MERLTRKVIRRLGEPYSSSLGIDLESKKEGEIFKWFLASFLFGKRIGESIAAKTYRLFASKNIITPDKILATGWNGLVAVLDEGGYVRYDFSTASRLLELMECLKRNYGSLTNLYEQAKDSKDLEAMLQEFKGVGPTTVNIFLRELRTIWPKANPEPSLLVKIAAKNLGIDLSDFKRQTKGFVELECALLRLGKNYCRKKRCDDCEFMVECRRL